MLEKIQVSTEQKKYVQYFCTTKKGVYHFCTFKYTAQYQRKLRCLKDQKNLYSTLVQQKRIEFLKKQTILNSEDNTFFNYLNYKRPLYQMKNGLYSSAEDFW